jgi:phosphoribosylpyrophosphate synthetase
MSDPARHFSSYYFDEALFETDEMLHDATEKLRNVRFDTLVGTGVSGTVFVPLLARELGKSWIIVRKERSEHSRSMLEGQLGRRWIFVDDLIDTGKTLRHVKKTIKSELSRDQRSPWRTVFGGSYLYRDDEFEPARRPKDSIRHEVRP